MKITSIQLAALCGLLLRSEPVFSQNADAIYTGGDIITINDAAPSAEALAVKDGKILAVGTKDEVLKTKGDGTQMVDLGGKNVLISRHYTYFDVNAIELPVSLRPLVHETQGHKWKMNTPLFDDFVQWIERQPRGMHGEPGDARPDEFWEGNRGCLSRRADDREGQTLCVRRDPGC